ncbi:MAG: cobalamin-dependent protein [Proteobacteria bacterium]|nr:cobalamin-dependent protein [Pseudomonadota bacterium]MBU1389035.1 cobalamin-dependent protein [Pseudomonadota bacterium]MBU1543587.1 cobalamin-dependent protein [Pseudomonadota bacterium]MBU2431801.1 cobalamin-dependent protein [Pseudomonadota bacterium]MBU2481938.1 cobalamin-dependent protein [Pseudomonadota bacterium]
MVNSSKNSVFPINALPACGLVREGIDTISHRAEVKKKAVLEYYSRVDADVLFCFSDIVIQAEAMGAKIQFSPNALPAVERPASGILLPGAKDVPRMQVNQDVIQALARTFPQKHVAAMVYGPFTVAGQVAGEQRIMKGLRNEPDQVCRLIDQCLEVALDYAAMQVDAGASLVWVSDPFASLLSPIDFEQFAQKYLAKIFLAFPGLPTALHICGETTPLVAAMAATGVKGISFDQCMNLLTIEDQVPDHIQIIGNIDPVEDIAHATVEHIDTVCRDLACLMGVLPNFSLSTGCALPITTPVENVTGFIQSSRAGLAKIQTHQQELRQLGNCVYSGDQIQTVELTQRLAAKEIAPETIIQCALMRAVRKASSLYESGRFYLPDLLLLTDAFYLGFEQVKKYLPETDSLPQILLGVVEGDFHEIGKDIVKAMLEANGFPVADLGTNVRAEDFVKAAKIPGIKIIGLSAFTTSSRKEIKKISLLVANDVPNRINIMVGGAAVSASQAKALGAEFYAKDAVGAVSLARQILKEPR